jgi:hypothetical protein
MKKTRSKKSRDTVPFRYISSIFCQQGVTLLTSLLPETLHTQLPDTLEQSVLQVYVSSIFCQQRGGVPSSPPSYQTPWSRLSFRYISSIFYGGGGEGGWGLRRPHQYCLQENLYILLQTPWSRAVFQVYYCNSVFLPTEARGAPYSRSVDPTVMPTKNLASRSH